MTYKHTQISYPMLVVTLAVLAIFARAYIMAAAEPPSYYSGSNFAVTAIMALILFALASFVPRQVIFDGKYLRIKFGYGIFQKKFALHDIVSARNVSGFDAVEIRLKNGKTYRVGTDEPKKLEQAIYANINMKKILVLCTGNSCRSQIAEAYLRHFAGGKAEIYSAGIETHGVNPRAIATMKEVGIDIAHHTSNNIDEYSGIDFDFVITVCDNAKEHCPVFPEKAKKFHQNFPDPAKAAGTEEEIAEQFRQVRGLIENYCRQFVADNL